MSSSINPRRQVQRLVCTTAAAWGLHWPASARQLAFAISY